MNPYLQAITALNKSEIPYCVVGGYAVVMHGVNRFTPDLNVVVSLEDRVQLERLFTELRNAHLEASQDVDVTLLFDEQRRMEYFDSGARRFLGFYDLQSPTFSVDIFVDYPMDRNALFDGLIRKTVAEGTEVTMCSLEHLIEMKSGTGRGQDKIDVENLEIILKLRTAVERGDGESDILDSFDETISRDRVENLLSFYQLPATEKMSWLQEMLTNLGQFCIV